MFSDLFFVFSKSLPLSREKVLIRFHVFTEHNIRGRLKGRLQWFASITTKEEADVKDSGDSAENRAGAGRSRRSDKNERRLREQHAARRSSYCAERAERVRTQARKDEERDAKVSDSPRGGQEPAVSPAQSANQPQYAPQQWTWKPPIVKVRFDSERS